MPTTIKNLKKQLADLEKNPQASIQQKIDVLNNLAWELQFDDPQKGIEFAQRAHQLAQKHNYQSGLAYSFNNIGSCAATLGNAEYGINYSFKSLTLFKTLNNQQGIAQALNTLGFLHFFSANYSQSLDYALKALKISQDNNNKDGEANALNCMGCVYLFLQEYSKALEVFFKSLALYNQLNLKKYQAMLLNNITMVQYNLGNYQDALQSGHKSLKLSQAIGSGLLQLSVLDSLGPVYLAIKDYKQALYHLNLGLTLAKKLGIKYAETVILFNIGQVYQRQQQADCLVFFEKSLALAQKIEAKKEIFDCHKHIAQFYESQGNFEEALKHYKQFHNTRELVFNEESNNKLKKLDIHYQAETAKKEAEIHQLKNIELKKEITERKRAEKEAKRWADEMIIVADINRQISATLNLTDVLKLIANRVKDLLWADNIAIFLQKPNLHTFHAAISLGEEVEALNALVVESGKGILGTIIKTGQAELINDTVQDPRSIHIPNTVKSPENTETMLCVPLTVRKNVIGLLALWRHHKNGLFTQKDLDFLINIARQAAIAIENARLFSDAQQAKEIAETANKQIQDELTLAYEIQQGILLNPRPNWPELDVICYNLPARKVGGDFYHYYAFPSYTSLPQVFPPHPALVIKEEKRYAFAIGDVSGKGVSAALLMAVSLSQLDASLTRTQQFSPTERLTYLDKVISPYAQLRLQNCALCYVELELGANFNNVQKGNLVGKLQVVNAGCIPPFIRHAKGQIEWPDIGGFALGLGSQATAPYKQVILPITKGDFIILSSDGVVEATNNNNEIYGFERLETAIATAPTNSAQAMLTHLQTQIESFVNGAKTHDDLTIIVIHI